MIEKPEVPVLLFQSHTLAVYQWTDGLYYLGKLGANQTAHPLACFLGEDEARIFSREIEGIEEHEHGTDTHTH